jgi:hypothetical protein
LTPAFAGRENENGIGKIKGRRASFGFPGLYGGF